MGAGARASAGEVRLAELIAALSLTTDLADGLPPETALKTCLLAVGLARRLGLSRDELSDTYYVGLLHNLGCTATAHETWLAVGDDVAFRSTFVGLDGEDSLRAMRGWLGGTDRLRRLAAAGDFVIHSQRYLKEGPVANCEVSSRLASRLAMGPGVVNALASFFERWDGRGSPTGISGESVPLAARITRLAYMVVQHLWRGGDKRTVRAKVRRWAGSWVDPRLAEVFLAGIDELVATVVPDSVWDQVVAAEPEEDAWMPASRRPQLLQAFADFADLKCVLTLRHSSAVSTLATAAAGVAGLPDGDTTALREAGLLHDIGRVSVSNGIWQKVGPLNVVEWERVRLHPYHTERILNRSPALEALALLASSDHERLDGSGYHRHLPGAALSVPARILAVAASYQSMLEPRVHRPALTALEAMRAVEEGVARGGFDREAARSVLAAAGQGRPRFEQGWPAGLTDREVEVVRQVAIGKSNKEIARGLFISEETLRTHLKHIYGKIGLSSRAGTALFAMEHDLIRH